ncbi:hypothetical protein Bca52824_093356 [Brassica carinata]|uniref:Uncharacterized protein n=1 Tax=Brassica carinata TaxID=52824 RepID=A0A8X7P586_BRACI|nr:hypothetical protein Bca52824_093356 [Brassica carinata]
MDVETSPTKQVPEAADTWIEEGNGSSKEVKLTRKKNKGCRWSKCSFRQYWGIQRPKKKRKKSSKSLREELSGGAQNEQDLPLDEVTQSSQHHVAPDKDRIIDRPNESFVEDILECAKKAM